MNTCIGICDTGVIALATFDNYEGLYCNTALASNINNSLCLYHYVLTMLVR